MFKWILKPILARHTEQIFNTLYGEFSKLNDRPQKSDVFKKLTTAAMKLEI